MFLGVKVQCYDALPSAKLKGEIDVMFLRLKKIEK